MACTTVQDVSLGSFSEEQMYERKEEMRCGELLCYGWKNGSGGSTGRVASEASRGSTGDPTTVQGHGGEYPLGKALFGAQTLAPCSAPAKLNFLQSTDNFLSSQSPCNLIPSVLERKLPNLCRIRLNFSAHEWVVLQPL